MRETLEAMEHILVNQPWGPQQEHNIVSLMASQPPLVGRLQRAIIGMDMLRGLQQDMVALRSTLAVGMAGDEGEPWAQEPPHPDDDLDLGDDHHVFRWKRARRERSHGNMGDETAMMQQRGASSRSRPPTDFDVRVAMSRLARRMDQELDGMHPALSLRAS